MEFAVVGNLLTQPILSRLGSFPLPFGDCIPLLVPPIPSEWVSPYQCFVYLNKPVS